MFNNEIKSLIRDFKSGKSKPTENDIWIEASPTIDCNLYIDESNKRFVTFYAINNGITITNKWHSY